MRTRGFTLPELLLTIIAIGGFIGWILNIVTIAGSSFTPLTGLLVLRVVGIFIAPLGAVLGYF